MSSSIDQLLTIACSKGASDLHIKAGSFPFVRVNGELQPMVEAQRLSAEDTLNMAFSIMNNRQKQRFGEASEIDIAYGVSGLGRFRCNIFQQRGTVGMVLRVIPTTVRTTEELRLPSVIEKIADENRGLVLVTGTTGSGKSTTLAAMIDYINRTRTGHIVTIEDPIEFLHRDKKSYVNQREVDVDTRSFSEALRGALRQDPDVILVGEMRDYETIETALTAAETGPPGAVDPAHAGRDRDDQPNRFGLPSSPAAGNSLATGERAQGRDLHEARARGRADTWSRPGGRSDGSDALHTRLHNSAGKDFAHPRRHSSGHFAIRDADVRPVAV